MKLIITGPRGFVGAKLMAQYPNAVPAPSLRNISQRDLEAFLDFHQPDAIIHTAAISDIPTCEAHPAESQLANVVLPVLLAKAKQNAKLVVFSSDQVYVGRKDDGPYTEDIVAPVNLYSQQKVEMERRVLDIAPDAVMLRAEWMYDWIAPKGNYIRNVLSTDAPLTFSRQEFRGVTYVKEVAENMDAVINLPGGAYNFGSETTQSMFQITQEFLNWMGKTNALHDCAPNHNLWMDCSKAAKLGVTFRTVSDALKRCAQDYHLL